MPHRDHEVRADEHHDLAGVDHLARCREFLVFDVADRLEHREQCLAVPLDLRPLMRLHGVLDRQRVQVEELGDTRELLVRRLVQAEPHETVTALAHPLHGVDQIAAARGPDAVPVRHAVHHRGTQRGSRGVTQVDPRAPPGQPRHPAQAADPSEAGDLPQIPCHGHLGLLAWISSRRIPAPWRASLPGPCMPWVSLWKGPVPFCSRLWTTGLRTGHETDGRPFPLRVPGFRAPDPGRVDHLRHAGQLG